MMTDQLESKKTINLNQDSKVVVNKMMLDFLRGNSINPIISSILYFYLENLHRLKIKEFRLLKLNMRGF